MLPTQRLTERQNNALEFIQSYLREHRKPPTLQEIGDALGIRSSNGVFKLLNSLEQKGYLEREKNRARGLRLVGAADAYAPDDELPNLPVVSRTASDQPDRLRLRPKLYFTIDPYFLRGVEEEDCLIGRAGDDGMNNDGIRKGDYLLIEEVAWEVLKNGDLVACLIGDALIARRFEHINGRHHLRSTARNYTDEMFAPDDPGCYIIGRVLGLMRKF